MIVNLLLLLVGCASRNAPHTLATQCVVSAEGVQTTDQASSLGFSGDDVVAALDMEHRVDVLDPTDTLVERVFSFVFQADGTQQVEETDPSCPNVVSGINLAIPGQLSVTVDDGWLTASGAATLRAQDAEADAVWIYATIAGAEVSAEAMSAISSEKAGCSEGDITVSFVQNSMPDAPWGLGPVGGLNSDGCGQGDYGVYTWGAVSFY